MASRNAAPAFVSLAATRARVAPTLDREAEQAQVAAMQDRFGACVGKVADTAIARVSRQRARAKTMVDTISPVTVTVPKREIGLVALAMFHNRVAPGVDAFCDAVTKAIDARLRTLGVDEQASVAFHGRDRRKVLVNIGPELSPAQRGAAAAFTPAGASVSTSDDGRVTALDLTGIGDRLRSHKYCLAACLTAVVRDYPRAEMKADLGITHARLRAFSLGEALLTPEEARTVLRNVADAALYQFYPIMARGTCGADIEKLLAALQDEQLFTR